MESETANPLLMCFSLTVSSTHGTASPINVRASCFRNGMPDRREVYVFGGCGDEADSLNWAEVFDTKTQTWEVLFVFTPKMPLNIEHSVVIDKELIYAVDDEGQDFSYSPSKCLFWTSGRQILSRDTEVIHW